MNVTLNSVNTNIGKKHYFTLSYAPFPLKYYLKYSYILKGPKTYYTKFHYAVIWPKHCFKFN